MVWFYESFFANSYLVSDDETNVLYYTQIANRYINIGDELTCNYNALNDYDDIYFDCNCNSTNCTKVVNYSKK